MILFKKYSFLLIVALLSLSFSACKDTPPIDDPIENNNGKYEYDPTPYSLTRPQFFPPLNIPSENALTEEGGKLGRMLFYDPILSGDSTLACAGCHKQENAFTDPRRFSLGIDGQSGRRNSMALFNLNWHSSFFWDGRELTLEEQIIQPVKDPIEMHEEWKNAVEKLKRHDTYPELFYNAFGVSDEDTVSNPSGVYIDSIYTSKAIAQFLRTILSYNSKYDKDQRGELFGTGESFTDSERNGQVLFFDEKADCFHCHGGTLFASLEPENQFRNNGLIDASSPSDYDDGGHGEVSNDPNDYGKFKAPSLRNIELTAPYMHDGRFNTLEEVVEFYNSGVHTSTYNVDPIMNKPGKANGLELTAQEKTDLVNFLKTLTDDELVNNPNYSSPF